MSQIPENVKEESIRIKKDLSMIEKGFRRCPECNKWVKMKHHHNVNGIIMNPFKDNGIRNVVDYECECGHKWTNRY